MGRSGPRGALGPSIVAQTPASTVRASLSSGSGGPTLIDPDTNRKCGCESSSLVVGRFLTKVGL